MPCHHVVEQLARKNRVFYINNFGALRDLTRFDAKRCFEKLSSRFALNKKDFEAREIDGVFVWQPWVVPTPRTKIIKKLNLLLLQRSLRSLYGRYHINNPIIWTRLANDLAWDLIEGLERSLLIYQSIDKFPEHPRIAESLRPRYRASERKFNMAADLVFASARGLVQDKIKLNTNTHFLPNGVPEDFGSGQRKVIEKMESLRGPIVGFAGALGTATDIDLLERVASGLPAANFIFMGTIDRTVSISRLDALHNVHLVGLVPHHDLPDWFAYFDIGLMPYHINYFQRFTFPSKLAEYLSCGLPIVSTPLLELEPYKKFVDVAHSADEMIDVIMRLLKDDSKNDDNLVAERKLQASYLTWQALVDKASSLVGLSNQCNA